MAVIVAFKRALYCVFFLQAEYGIRDGHVTGVQTCALPICLRSLITGAAAVTVASCSPGRGDRSCRGEYDSPVVGAGRQRALWTTPDRPAPHLSTAFTWAGQTVVRRSR